MRANDCFGNTPQHCAVRRCVCDLVRDDAHLHGPEARQDS